MNNYRRGAAVEYRMKSALEEEGALVVRSAGSHSPIDLIAIYPNMVRLIQCKRVKGKQIPNFKEDLDKLRGVRCPDFCKRELHVWQDGKGFSKSFSLNQYGLVLNHD